MSGYQRRRGLWGVGQRGERIELYGDGWQLDIWW